MKISLHQLRLQRDVLLREIKLQKFTRLGELAVASMKSHRASQWAKKNPKEADKSGDLVKQAVQDRSAFDSAYREYVSEELRTKWNDYVQGMYVRGENSAIFFYLGGEPKKIQGLGHSLKSAADEYIRGWEVLSKKERRELPVPTAIVDGSGALAENGIFAVQYLIMKLESMGELEKTQAQILGVVFKKMLEILDRKKDPKGFVLGETLASKDDNAGSAAA